MFSANKIAGFFSLEYLLIGSRYASDYLHVDDIYKGNSWVKVFRVDNDFSGKPKCEFRLPVFMEMVHSRYLYSE